MKPSGKLVGTKRGEWASSGQLKVVKGWFLSLRWEVDEKPLQAHADGAVWVLLVQKWVKKVWWRTHVIIEKLDKKP